MASESPNSPEVSNSTRVQAARAEEARRVTMERDIGAILEHQTHSDQIMNDLLKRWEQAITEIGSTKNIMVEHLNQVRDRREFERLVEIESRVRALQDEKTKAFIITEEDERRALIVARKVQQRKARVDFAAKLLEIAVTIIGLVGALKIAEAFG